MNSTNKRGYKHPYRKRRPHFREVDKKPDNKPKVVDDVPKTTKTDKVYTAKLDLPSRFLPYEFSELHVRRLTVGEVKRIREMVESGSSGYTLADTLTPAMSVHPGELTMGDFWYVLAWLRLNTFTNTPMTLQWVCSSCGSKQESNINLPELEIQELRRDYIEPATVRCPNGEEVNVRLYRVKDEQSVKHYLKTMLGREEWKLAEEWIPDLAVTIENGWTLHKKVEWLSNKSVWDPDSLRYLEKFESYCSHGLPNFVKGICKECEYVNERIRFSFRFENVLPYNTDPRNYGDAVSFGSSL